MLFNFKETYASRSNEELAQIVAHPDRYQPEAVTAARALLAERNVTEDELRDMIYPPQAMEVSSAGNAVQYEDGQTNIFEDVQARPLSEQTRKRMKFIAVGWGAICLYYTFQSLLSYLRSFRLMFDVQLLIFASITTLAGLFPVVCIYLLYKRKKWGWLLSTGFMTYYAILQLIICTYMLGSMIPSGNGKSLDRFLSLPALVIYIISLRFLLDKQFRNEFFIPANIIWRPILIGGGISLLSLYYTIF